MATVADLLDRLHRQAWELAQQRVDAPDEALGQHMRGWVKVAASASRALAPLHIRRDLDDVLDQLADGGLASPGRPDRRLVEMSLTYGGIGDLLAAEQVHVELAGYTSRSRLHTSMWAGLHTAARATLAVAQDAGATEPAAVLAGLADITELAALIPPSARENLLDRLSATPARDATLKGAVDTWAAVAGEILSSDHQVTGYALQRTAGSIAMICHVAASTTKEAAAAGLINTDSAHQAADSLQQTARSWRRAANWPPHLRLGGRTTELRQASASLDRALTGPQLAGLDVSERLTSMWAAVNLATLVGDEHRVMTSRLATGGGLWVSVAALPPAYQATHPGARRSGWVPQPPSSTATSRPLAIAARTAAAALRSAATDLDAAVEPIQTGPPRRVTGSETAQAWETVTPPTRRDHRDLRPESPMLPGLAL